VQGAEYRSFLLSSYVFCILPPLLGLSVIGIIARPLTDDLLSPRCGSGPGLFRAPVLCYLDGPAAYFLAIKLNTDNVIVAPVIRVSHLSTDGVLALHGWQWLLRS